MSKPQTTQQTKAHTDNIDVSHIYGYILRNSNLKACSTAMEWGGKFYEILVLKMPYMYHCVRIEIAHIQIFSTFWTRHLREFSGVLERVVEFM